MTPPLSLLSSRLLLNHLKPGRSRAVSAGLAGRRWRRRGAGVGFSSSCRFFGSLPVFWSRAARSLAKIWCIWRVDSGDELRRAEQAVSFFLSRISRNKGLFRCLTSFWRLVLALLLLAGHGGEGERSSGIRGSSWSFSLACHGGEGGNRPVLASSSSAAVRWGCRCGGCILGRSNSIPISLSCRGGEGRGGGGVPISSRWSCLWLHYFLELIQMTADAAPVSSQVHHHYLICFAPPSPRVRGRSFGLDGELVFSVCCWRASVPLLEWLGRSRTFSVWSFFSASVRKTSITPVCSGKSTTSVMRPFYGSDAERFARSKASGVVPSSAMVAASCTLCSSVGKRMD